MVVPPDSASRPLTRLICKPHDSNERCAVSRRHGLDQLGAVVAVEVDGGGDHAVARESRHLPSVHATVSRSVNRSSYGHRGLAPMRPVIVRLSGGRAAPERALEPDQIPVGISYKELTHAGFLLADPVPRRFGLHEQLDPCRSQR